MVKITKDKLPSRHVSLGAKAHLTEHTIMLWD